MNISIITGSFLPLPPAPCGAVERLWHDLGREFARRGHRVTFLAHAHPSQRADETAGNVTYVRRGNWRRTGKLPFDLAQDLAYSVRMLGRLPAADILVTNVFWLPVLARPRPEAGRLVVNLQRYPKGQLPLYRGAARLAAVSRAVYDAVVEQFPAGAAITRVIPNPIDVETFVPPSEPRRDDGERVILYTGRVHPEKGLHLLIDAFARAHARHPRLRLRVVGPSDVVSGGGGEPYLRTLRDKAGGLPVEILPPLYGRAALAGALGAAHAYCYPSLAERGESFGVAPLEAMGTGLAPVVSGLRCFADFVEDGVNGWVFDHRAADAPGQLADALGRALSDAPRAERMGRAAAQTAARFSINRVADAYLQDFETLLRGPRRRHGGGGESPPAG